jgi:dienelactone hydrolase
MAAVPGAFDVPRMRSLVACVLLVACADPSETMPPGGDPQDPPDDPTPGVTGPVLPSPTGTCPELVPGDVTFAPAGMPPRKVALDFDPAVASKSELVIYWHATGSGPFEAAYSFGDTLDEIKARGGIVAAPYSDDTAGTFEWFIVNQSPKLDDFLLADEIVGCLAERIDAKRIHSIGMSAGGLQTTAFSFMRSNYVASVATFSGGIPAGFSPAIEDPDNKFAALIFEGGAQDNVFGVDFQAASESYRAMLEASGHFAAICDHGNGHDIPLDAAPSVDAFFLANPYGAWPSPYASSGLPASFPSYCAR